LGEVNYPFLFAVIDEAAAGCGWQGWIGCEYRPARGAVANGTSDGLDWLRRWRAAT
jgi:hydroxypyruvate isomerase